MTLAYRAYKIQSQYTDIANLVGRIRRSRHIRAQYYRLRQPKSAFLLATVGPAKTTE